jgi:hypothetical protein
MVIYRGNLAATHFLNVDLDLHSSRDLQALVTALGERVVVLYAGRIKRTHRVHLELAKITKTADATIRGFCALIKALPKVDRNLWNAAKVRDFNIGVQAGSKPHCSEFALATETIKVVYRLGARIVFTVYAPRETSQQAAKGRRRSKSSNSQSSRH